MTTPSDKGSFYIVFCLNDDISHNDNTFQNGKDKQTNTL